MALGGGGFQHVLKPSQLESPGGRHWVVNYDKGGKDGPKKNISYCFLSAQHRAQIGLKAVAKGVIRSLAEPADGSAICGKLSQHYSKCLSLGAERVEATTILLCEHGFTKHPSLFWKLSFDVVWLNTLKEELYYRKGCLLQCVLLESQALIQHFGHAELYSKCYAVENFIIIL